MSALVVEGDKNKGREAFTTSLNDARNRQVVIHASFAESRPLHRRGLISIFVMRDMIFVSSLKVVSKIVFFLFLCTRTIRELLQRSGILSFWMKGLMATRAQQ